MKLKKLQWKIRKKENDKKIKQIREDCGKFMKDIEDKYNSANENIMEKKEWGKNLCT